MRVQLAVRALRVVVWALAGYFLAHAVQSGAQSTPSAEELQMFQGLTPEQQQAIMDRLTGMSSGGDQSSSALGRLGGQGQLDLGRGNSLGNLGQLGGLDQLSRSRILGAQDEDEEEQDLQRSSLIPTLRRDEWVIIEVDYQLGPRPVPPYLQSLYAVQAAQNAQAGVSGAVSAALQNGQAGAAQAAAQLAAQTAVQQNSAANSSGANNRGPGPVMSASGQPLANASGSPVTAYEAQLSEEDRARVEALMALIRLKNPYRLSHDGALTLPGFAPISLLGLTEEQATLRLKVEPALRGIDIRLTALPIKKTGAEGLKPFGYDLFDHPMSTFAPVTNVPVPSNYIVGSGDRFDVQMYGTQNRSLRLTVARDGHINLPGIGPVHIGGMTFDAAKADIEARVQKQMIGVHASVSMGDTRSIRVFVLGEARYPGSYTISGLGTITSALYAAGGAKRAGSLRSIQLKRDGALVRQFDLYDLLIRGDTTDDTKLLQGDVILIPPVGPTVSIDGEVRRPAVYELKGAASVGGLVQLAGGLTPEADRSNAMLTRIDENQHRVIMPIDVTTAGETQVLQNGDLIRIMRLRPTLSAGIVVQGHLYSPGNYAFRAGMRVSDVVRSIDELRPDADIHYVLIRRENPPDRHISVLSADLAAALKAPGSAADLELMPRDRITVFDLGSGRDRVIQPLMDELRVQGNALQPTETVHVDGQVKVPGEYPLENGMRVSDLIRAGGGRTDAAYAQGEITRYNASSGNSRITELIPVDLTAVVRGDASADIRLQPYDTLTVKELPLWEAQESISIRGEVRFPGVYTIRRGETLKSVIERAGGLTPFAFPDGSVFTREWLRKREQDQLDMLAARMETDITALAVGAAASGAGGSSGGAGALSLAQALLGQVRSSRAVGRMVIDLPRLLREPAGSPDDVILRVGDQLIVPRFQQQVTVLGEVQNSTSLLFNPRMSRDDYIAQSGGTTRRADRGQIYVVRANGSVVANQGGTWFRVSSGVNIKPGDTIVVPLNVESMPPLPFWQAVTGIVYNVAIAVAAVHAL